MNAKVETEGSKLDTVKLVLAAGVLIAGVTGFYHFEDESLLFRVLGLVGVAIVAILICLQTNAGRGVLAFGKESRTEVRKVVWPTRTETIQTTLSVFVVVILVGIFLWLLDMLLVWAVQILTGQGG